jgi:hypothetical protein
VHLFKPGNERRALAILAILTRLIFLIYAAAQHLGTTYGPMAYDGYIVAAQSLAWHGVLGFDGIHSITTRSPLLPLALVPGVWVGNPVLWTLLLNALFGIGAILNTQAAARGFGASRRAAFLAGLFVALNPWLLACSLYAATTLIAAFLMSCLLRCLAERRYALLGLCGGLLALCHPACAFALPGALAAEAIRRGPRTVLRPVLVALGVCALIWSPWIVRNYALSGRFIPGIDGFGFQYMLGSAGVKFGRPAFRWTEHLLPPGHYAVHATLDDYSNRYMDAMARKELTNDLLHHPGALLWRCARQFVWFWVGDKRIGLSLLSIAHLLYLLPLLYGAVRSMWARWKTVGALILVGVPTILIHSLVVALSSETMYSLPVIPLLAVMAACSGLKFLEEQPAREHPPIKLEWQGVRPTAPTA